MGHYAYVNEDCIVERVIKISLVDINKMFGEESVNTIPGWLKTSYNTLGGVHYKPCITKKEILDEEVIDEEVIDEEVIDEESEEESEYSEESWSELSKTPEKAIRKNYAKVGSVYIRELDAFIDPQPYPSWTLDTYAGLWKAPVKKQLSDFAKENIVVDWDEELLTWVNLYTNEVWNNTLEEWE